MKDKEYEITNFISLENSLIQKAKRYDEDIRYLLNLLYDERRRHSQCEEDLMVYANPANISKVQRLELLDRVVETISCDWGNKNPFVNYNDLEDFNCYTDKLIDSNCPEKIILGKIYKLFIEHFNRPSAC